MKIEFDVYMPPTGKARPRFRMVHGHAVAYTPKKTKDAEEDVARAYLKAAGGKTFGKRPVVLNVYVDKLPPKEASKKTKEEMVAGYIRPACKPDADNCLKLVSDALNGVAYDDDRQIVEMRVVKTYSYTEKTHIRIEDAACNVEVRKINQKQIDSILKDFPQYKPLFDSVVCWKYSPYIGLNTAVLKDETYMDLSPMIEAEFEKRFGNILISMVGDENDG